MRVQPSVFSAPFASRPAGALRRSVTLGAFGVICIAGIIASGCKTSAADASPATATDTSSASGAVAKTKVGTNPGNAGRGTPLTPAAGHELAAFAEGCFWGSENTFRHVPGVTATAVGYTGGHTDDPDYEAVCTHTTGHAETVLVEYDPKIVTYADLVSDFWKSHDPTTKNRQGPDVGTNYRSAIFTFSPAQDAIVKTSLANEQTRLGKTITTEVAPIGKFWKAEEYHQQYDEKSGRESCPLFLATPAKAS